MRKKDIDSLIEHTKNGIKNIETEYTKALHDKDIKPSLQIDIKNFMENLRSVLDYIAHDIYEELLSKESENKKIYFPYSKKETDFKSSIGSNLPELELVNEEIYKLIENIQPHKCKNNWLYDFCSILNENKHKILSPQTRTENQTMTAKAGNVSVSVPINNPNFSIKQGKNAQVFIGGVPVRFGQNGIEPLAPGLERTIITWVSFKFDNTDVHVMPLLKKTLEEIGNLTNEIYKII